MILALFTAFATVPTDVLDHLSEAGTWDGERTGYAGIRSPLRLAWERLRDQATDAELVDLLDHEDVAVRYGALRALEGRVDPHALPDVLLKDDERLKLCSGGCLCMDDSVGDRLAEMRTSVR